MLMCLRHDAIACTFGVTMPQASLRRSATR